MPDIKMDLMVNKPSSTLLLFFCLVLFCGQLQCMTSNNVHLNSFTIEAVESVVVDSNGLNVALDGGTLVRAKRDASDVTETESEGNDPKCEKQKDKFSKFRDSLKSGERLEETHVFVNESKFNLALAWAGQDDDGTLVVLTSSSKVQFYSPVESTLWRSTDHGRNWIDWSEKVNHEKFRKDDGLQRNPHNPKKIYLVSYAHFIYVTEDGGKSWTKRELTTDENEKLTLSVDEILEFHGDSDKEDNIAVIDNKRRLFVTYDNFQKKPQMIKSNVHNIKWGTLKSMTDDYVYTTTGDFKSPLYGRKPVLLTLERYDKKTGEWKQLLHRVKSFNIEGKFMYASIYKSEDPATEEASRLMMISTDGGDSWKEARLPTVTGDRFFSVMDMSEDLIFMHVDNPGDTGHGILYTSSSMGIVYSESLPNHLYPNYNSVHDFYKIKSIRGVYLASQMGPDKSIHTVITYNQGAEWKNVSRPLDVECANSEKNGCTLQIHNAYSIHRGIKARMPHSSENAPGLVLVHAHVASNLQTTPPDVFLSTDGGYNFKRVLKGPHAYEIADSGGLLVAISLSTNTPNTIKFSTDEGNCWHTYKFTNESIKFTGLLTEPGGKSMTVSIWGYEVKTKKWTINVIDFNKVICCECKVDDYRDWIPHISLNKDANMAGCLLGRKEIFKKIKPDSWCRNGYSNTFAKAADGKICPCTREDFECDFGFYREVGEEKCIRQKEIKSEEVEICNGKKLEEIITIGYRKLPGDVCDHNSGFKPISRLKDLGSACNLGEETDIKHDEKPPKKAAGYSKLVFGVIIGVVMVVLAVVGAFFLYKMILLRRHKTVYRYSMLNQGEEGENEFENALTNHDTLYHDTSDDEVEQENRSPKHQQANGKFGKRSGPGLSSYHDDSDDDMLG